MLGGFSSKNSPASFAPQPIPALRTREQWVDALAEVKSLYQQEQYRQCAIQAKGLLKSGKRPLQIHPIHQVFLGFYAAISYELLSQKTHIYSSTKISLLNAALDCFVDCGAALPEPIALPKPPDIGESLPPPNSSLHYPTIPRTPIQDLMAFDGGVLRSPERVSLVQTITRLIDISLWDLTDDPFISASDNENEKEFKKPEPFMLCLSPVTSKSRTKAEQDRLCQVMASPTRTPSKETKEPTKKNTLIPSPLRVRKIPEELYSPSLKPKPLDISRCKSRSQSKSTTRTRPPPLPLTVIPATRLNIGPQKGDKRSPIAIKAPLAKRNDTKFKPSKKTTTGKPAPVAPASTAPTEKKPLMCAAKIDRYNRAIELLRSQITMNISSIQQHVDHVMNIQRTRRSRKMQHSISFWSFDPIKGNDEENTDMGKETELFLDEFGNVLVKETKDQRIARLRAEGWETVGLRSPRSTWKGSLYYQELCTMVMSEIYMEQ